MTRVFGFIGEDTSDYEVFIEILSKYTSRNKMSFKKFLGKGCGKISCKLTAWCEDLISDGCEYIFVVHDLDQKKMESLKTNLESKISNIKKKKNILIIIPIIEIESWLLTNSSILTNIFEFQSSPKLPTNPELLKDPKKELINIIKKHRKSHRLIYIPTQHNKVIMKKLTLNDLKKCSSFLSFHNNIQSLKIFK